eukprot:COSAG06_NODE_1408_length_9549_cov_12.628677_2_plen_46_part_00
MMDQSRIDSNRSGRPVSLCCVKKKRLDLDRFTQNVLNVLRSRYDI